VAKNHEENFKIEPGRVYLGPPKETKTKGIDPELYCTNRALSAISVLTQRKQKRVKRYLIQRFQDELGVES